MGEDANAVTTEQLRGLRNSLIPVLTPGIRTVEEYFARTGPMPVEFIHPFRISSLRRQWVTSVRLRLIVCRVSDLGPPVFAFLGGGELRAFPVLLAAESFLSGYLYEGWDFLELDEPVVFTLT